ncbi:MAG: GAF domain-containing sensor histidine kinase [Bacteroidales bacterium]|nr:GAF domain-containing sensor histidine kinase [Bacteroidales bacterium]
MKEKKFSKVTVRENGSTERVSIASELKPEMDREVIEKWQSLLDLTAKLMNVPSALIMKLNEQTIEVFLKSQSKGNPYKVGGKEELIHGLYCETVIGKQEKLLVPDASKSEIWKENNPDMDLNMISYLGMPLNYPDGEVFGTVCVLDNKENHYGPLYEELLDKVKQHIETDLKLHLSNQELEEKNHQLEQANEINSKFLSLISHDLRGSVSSMDRFIKLMLTKFHQVSKDELGRNLQTLGVTTNSMYQTLQDLLSWSKQDLLQLEPQKEHVELKSVIDRILDFFKPRIEFKELEVSTDYPSDQVFVYADANMLETALRNIVSNAIKFNESNGAVYIGVFETARGAEIIIEDKGIGMDEKTVNKLFSYDYSVDLGNKNNEESSGLGLMLSKEFLQKNDATVSVSSTPGEGTRFTITI